MMIENAYFAKEVAEQVGISTSTLRKWCLLLEENSYKFIRNEKNQRLFVPGDIRTLKRFKALAMDEGKTLENAVKIICEEVEKEYDETKKDASYGDIKSMFEGYEEKIDHLLDHIERQERFNRELVQRLEEQQQYMDEKMNKRDQQMMTAIREMQETKQLLAAAEEEKKKSFFQRLFGK